MRKTIKKMRKISIFRKLKPPRIIHTRETITFKKRGAKTLIFFYDRKKKIKKNVIAISNFV